MKSNTFEENADNESLAIEVEDNIEVWKEVCFDCIYFYLLVCLLIHSYMYFNM